MCHCKITTETAWLPEQRSGRVPCQLACMPQWLPIMSTDRCRWLPTDLEFSPQLFLHRHSGHLSTWQDISTKNRTLTNSKLNQVRVLKSVTLMTMYSIQILPKDNQQHLPKVTHQFTCRFNRCIFTVIFASHNYPRPGSRLESLDSRPDGWKSGGCTCAGRRSRCGMHWGGRRPHWGTKDTSCFGLFTVMVQPVTVITVQNGGFISSAPYIVQEDFCKQNSPISESNQFKGVV